MTETTQTRKDGTMKMQVRTAERFVVATKGGCVCGRGPTLNAAILTALRQDDFAAYELIAGDNETQTQATSAEIATAIEAVDGTAARQQRPQRQATKRERMGRWTTTRSSTTTSQAARAHSTIPPTEKSTTSDLR